MGRLGRALSTKKKLLRPHERASANKNRNVSVKTHEERKKEKRDLQAIKDLEKSLLESGKAKRVAAAKKRAAKKARKAENEIKSGHYQIIKDTEKIRRWHKKAKRDLVKMSQEQMNFISQRAGH
ncbi:unnamed protein product [Amoebophrya sp. A120]|nr:unnamed protein product [Amoebophrya sp. A120]|eukprot:GSA120T00000366001.1